MTVVVQTFGVTWEMVRTWIPQFPVTLGAGTVPSSDAFDFILNEEASDLCARLTQMGIEPLTAAAVPGSQIYGIMRKSITLACATRALIAAERTPTEMFTAMVEQQQARFDRITAQPGSLGDGQNAEVFTIDSHVTDQAALRRNVGSRGLAAALASRGQV